MDGHNNSPFQCDWRLPLVTLTVRCSLIAKHAFRTPGCELPLEFPAAAANEELIRKRNRNPRGRNLIWKGLLPGNDQKDKYLVVRKKAKGSVSLSISFHKFSPSRCLVWTPVCLTVKTQQRAFTFSSHTSRRASYLRATRASGKNSFICMHMQLTVLNLEWILTPCLWSRTSFGSSISRTFYGTLTWCHWTSGSSGSSGSGSGISARASISTISLFSFGRM